MVSIYEVVQLCQDALLDDTYDQYHTNDYYALDASKVEKAAQMLQMYIEQHE